MISLSRRLLREWHSVLKRAFRLTARGPAPTLQLTAGPTGLVLRACFADQFVEYRQSEPQAAQQIAIPLAVIADLHSSRPEPVSLEVLNSNVLEVRWQEHGASHVQQYPLGTEMAIDFPGQPTEMTSNPPSLGNAFREAFATTDPTSSRYALSCVQIQGERGILAATDGHQMLQQRGFRFGFEQDVLLRPTRVFECSELTEAEAIQIGRLEKHLVLQAGAWTVWLPLQLEGRFPRIEDVIPSAASAITRLELSPVDARFLAENVERLPMVAPNHDVTLDLNGHVIVRGKSASTPLPTELVLRNSTKEGADLRLSSDRRFLVRAAKLGLQQFYLRAADQTILAQDATRSYVWMPLSTPSCIAPSDDALRIESPVSTSVPHSPRTMTTKPSETTSTCKAPAKPVSRACKPAGAIEQATILRDQLRTMLSTVKELIRTLKTENRSRKSLKQALNSLKQLQAA